MSKLHELASAIGSDVATIELVLRLSGTQESDATIEIVAILLAVHEIALLLPPRGRRPGFCRRAEGAKLAALPGSRYKSVVANPATMEVIIAAARRIGVTRTMMLRRISCGEYDLFVRSPNKSLVGRKPELYSFGGYFARAHFWLDLIGYPRTWLHRKTCGTGADKHELLEKLLLEKLPKDWKPTPEQSEIVGTSEADFMSKFSADRVSAGRKFEKETWLKTKRS